MKIQNLKNDNFCLQMKNFEISRNAAYSNTHFDSGQGHTLTK